MGVGGAGTPFHLKLLVEELSSVSGWITNPSTLSRRSTVETVGSGSVVALRKRGESQ